MKSPTAPASIMWSFFPSEIIPKACHSEKGDGLILPSTPAFTPPWNWIMAACPEGADILTGKRLTVSHGMIMSTVMARVNQNSCCLINLDLRSALYDLVFASCEILRMIKAQRRPSAVHPAKR